MAERFTYRVLTQDGRTYAFDIESDALNFANGEPGSTIYLRNVRHSTWISINNRKGN